MSIEARARAGVAQAWLSSGCPSGRGQVIGASPITVDCHSIAFAASSRRCGLRTVALSARYVATRSSEGSRSFTPREPLNSTERTSSRSTGTIAVSCWR